MVRKLKVMSEFFLFCTMALLLFISSLSTNVVLAQDTKEYQIGVDGTYPPFSHKKANGEFVGFDIDVAKAICKSMKAKCNITAFKWSNLLAALRGEKVDFVIAAIRATQARRELVEFSNPYIKIPSAIVVRKNSILSGIEVEDLRDAQFGVLKSSPHGEYLRVHRSETHVKLYENQAEYYIDLINRQLDGIVGNPVLLDAWLQSADGKACCRMLDTLPHDPQINGEGLAVAVGKDSKLLLQQINKSLASLNQSGQMEKITRTHLPFLK